MQSRIEAVLGIAILSLSGLPAASAHPAQASWTTLGALPNTNEDFCGATTISADGAVVGGYARTSLSADGREAVLWSAGTTPTGLGGFPTLNVWGHVRDLSQDGAVAVGSTTKRNLEQAFRYSAASGMQALALPSGCEGGEARGVSADGEVTVGRCDFIVQHYEAPVHLSEAVVWRNGHPKRLGFLPGGVLSLANAVSANGRAIVGEATTGAHDGSRLAVIWIDDQGPFEIGDVPGGLERSAAVAVSADGQIACGWGTTTTNPYRQQFFRWTRSGGLIPLGKLPGHYHARPNDMSPNGDFLVGWSAAAGSSNRSPVIWDPVHGMRDIVALVEGAGIDLSAWRDSYGNVFMEATGVSADGRTVVGYGHLDNTRRAWIATLP